MLLIGNLGVSGLGMILISELARGSARREVLFTTALLLSSLFGTVLGVACVIVLPRVSPQLAPLVAAPTSAAVFVAGVILTGLTLVLDQALVGLLRGELQLMRNAIFALAKLGLLAAAGAWLAGADGVTIYSTWVGGNIASLAGLIATSGAWRARRRVLRACRPDWELVRRLRTTTLAHHALCLALQLPGLALPVLVAVLLSTTATAYFYAAWMIANAVFVLPVALTTSVYAVTAREPLALSRRIRFTLCLSIVAGVLTNSVVQVGANHVLGLFGGDYAQQAAPCLRLLALAVFPLIVKDHYVAIYRIRSQVFRTALVTAGGGALELAAAAVGANVGGLTGLSVGWLAALCGEAIIIAAPVLGAVLDGGGLRLWPRQPPRLGSRAVGVVAAPHE
jgi:O-antigen/teichoic acid export membrane protein